MPISRALCIGIALALTVSGCASTPTKFYADRGKQSDEALCRVALDPEQDLQFRRDVTDELIRRGLTGEICQNKVVGQNIALGTIAAVALGVTVAAACKDGCSLPSGGGYSAPAARGVDYDCAGGSGDGPYFVQGPFPLTGPDVYGLDRDHDGIACEPYDEW